MKDPVQALIDLPDDLPFAVQTGTGNPNPPPVAVAYTPVSDEPRHEITNPDAIRTFIEAGHAIFTLVSKKSGTRFTYKLTRPAPEKSTGPNRPIWVAVLTGSDNTTSYTFTGSIWLEATGYVYRPGRKSTMSMAAPSMVMFSWFIKKMNGGDEASILRQAEFWHEGRCCRCGRRLTVPESIESGIGPECAKK